MPTYTYKCECGNEIDILHGVNDSPDITCEECGSKMKKLINYCGHTVLKGSGFYTNDYGKGSLPKKKGKK